VFIKGFALTAQEFPELRRVYLKYPWPHLYEYGNSVAALTVERSINGESAVPITCIKRPAELSIAHIDRRIRRARIAPINSVKDFRRLPILARLPLACRRLVMWLGLNIGRQRANHFGTFCLRTSRRLARNRFVRCFRRRLPSITEKYQNMEPSVFLQPTIIGPWMVPRLRGH
jgi:hypothetical protein